MSSFSKSDVATVPSAVPAGRATHALATGKVKAVNADNKEFVLTDDAGGKEWTFKLGGDVVINRGGNESPTGLKTDDAVVVCSANGAASGTAHYILVKEGTTKDWRLARGTFKNYDAAKREFTYAETGGQDKTYPMGDANVRLNMKASRIEDIKTGDNTLAIVERVGDKLNLKALMFSRN
jgi:hypothetical protein